MKWEMVKLGDVFSRMRNGASIKQTERLSGIPITRIETISDGQINKDKLGYADINDDKYKEFYLEHNDILMSHINSWTHLGKNAIVDNINEKIIHGMNLLLLRADTNKIIPKFAKRYFDTIHFRNSIYKVANQSVNQSSFSVNNLKEIQIPLPPLGVQKEIAAILDTADALRKKDNELLKKYEELAQSIFIEMFGDLTDSKYDKSILTALTDIANGVTKNTKAENSEMITAPYLRVANVQDGFLDLSEIKNIRVSKTDFEKYQLKENDILLTEGGDPDKLGRGTTWKNEVKHCIFQNHLFRVRIKSKEIIRPFYLSKLISSSYGKKYFLKAAKQTTGIATINSTQLKHFPVIIPRLKTQIDFENICLKIDETKVLGNSTLTHTNNLFHSLLQKAFKGELT